MTSDQQSQLYVAYLQGFAARMGAAPITPPNHADPAYVLAWIIGSIAGGRDRIDLHPSRIMSPAQLAAVVAAKLDEPMPDPAV